MVNHSQFRLLKKSVNEWNKWREENPKIEIDLSRVNLYDANLGNVNLSNANLCDGELRAANLYKANLRGAELRGAYFNNANLNSANLSDAYLSGTYLNSTNLSNARLHSAYLSNAYISNANLSGADLSNANLGGVNLSNAELCNTNLSNTYLSKVNLSNANLCNANLSNANLYNAYLYNAHFKNACLQNAYLKTAQALYTNFQNANLTGACIEDWNINSETQFDCAICEYIYLRNEYQEDKWVFTERRPHNYDKIFAPGDFIRLIQKTSETLDLIFSEGIDWTAFAQTFQGIQIQTGSDELSIQAIEKKRDGSFIIKVNTPTSDKAALEKEFWKKYRPLIEAKDREIKYQKELLTEVRHHNTNLTEIVMMLGSRPINVEAKTVAYSIKQEGNFGIGHMSGGEIKDSNFAGVINEAEQQNLAQAAAEIQDLLEQLEKSYPTETTADKMGLAAEAITQVENNPTLKGKIVRAVKAGSMAAMEKLLNHPAASFVAAALRELK